MRRNFPRHPRSGHDRRCHPVRMRRYGRARRSQLKWAEAMMTEQDIKPYRISFSDEAIADLHDRLRRTRWPDDYVDHDWDLGTDQTYLKSLCDYWRGG